MPSRKAALFDAGDTLLHWNVHKRDRFVWVLEQAGIAVPDDPAARWEASRAADRFFYSQLGRSDSWSDAWWTEHASTGLTRLGLPVELAAHIAAYRFTLPMTYTLDPDAIPVLAELRGRGYQIGLVSNWDGSLAAKCEEAGLLPYVDYVGDSTVFGQPKPAAAFFHHVLEQLEVPPEAAFHVGDYYDADVEGARAAGITPILLDIFGCEDRTCEYVATDLRDVLRIRNELF
jgi:putative hydrolase of the HAD superfamily